MERNFSASLRGFAASTAAVCVTVVLAATSAGVASPMQTALVESIIGQPTAVEVMDYVNAGQIIRLRSRDTIVLSYLRSCVRETITGGTVTVGIDRSEVQAGQVTRSKIDCGERTFVLTGGTETQFAGRVFRGLKPEVSDSLVGGPEEAALRN